MEEPGYSIFKGGMSTSTEGLLLICTAHQQGAKHEYSVVRKQELF